MNSILNTLWGYIVSVLGNGGWGALWTAGAAGAVVALFVLADAAQGMWKEAGQGLLMMFGISIPALLSWGFCRLYAHVLGREVDGWFWPAAGVAFGLFLGWTMATEERK